MFLNPYHLMGATTAAFYNVPNKHFLPVLVGQAGVLAERGRVDLKAIYSRKKRLALLVKHGTLRW